MTNPFAIGILVFDDVEALDFIGPLEVFGIARDNGAPLKTVLVGKHHADVRARFGLTFKPEATLASCPPLGLLVVPGGSGARGRGRHGGNTLAFSKRRTGDVASRCAGALSLAAAPLLDDKGGAPRRARAD